MRFVTFALMDDRKIIINSNYITAIMQHDDESCDISLVNNTTWRVKEKIKTIDEMCRLFFNRIE